MMTIELCKCAAHALTLCTPTPSRGGIIAIIKADLQLVTAEIVRISSGNDFAQAIVLTDRVERAYRGWYNSPLMHRNTFNDTLSRL